MVQLKWARLSEQTVKRLGFKHYSFREYKKMAHSSCERVSAHCHYSLGKYLLLDRLGNEGYRFIHRSTSTQSQLIGHFRIFSHRSFVSQGIQCKCQSRRMSIKNLHRISIESDHLSFHCVHRRLLISA